MNPVISNSRPTIAHSVPAVPESSKNDLLLAIDEAQTEKALAILKKSDLATSPLSNGQMPLNYAIRNYQLELVEAMLKELKLDMGAKDCHGLTAVDHAMIGGMRKMISLVLGTSLGQAFEAAGVKMTTPMQDREIAQYSELTASLRSGKYFLKKPLPELHQAAREGNLAKVKELLNPKDPNPYDPYGWTPLHHATLTGNEGVALWLLKNGAHAEILTQGSQSLLHLASIGGHANLVPTLVSKHKQNPNAADNWGRTPLHYAVVQEDLSTAKALVQQGARLVLSEGSKPSPLDILIEVAKARSTRRDPLSLSTLQLLMLLGMFGTSLAPWHQQYLPFKLMINIGLIARILTAAFSLNSDKSSSTLDSPRSKAAFCGSMAITYLAPFLEEQALKSGNRVAATLIAGVWAAEQAWKTYHIVKAACKGLSNCWENRCYVNPEIRPISNAGFHFSIAYEVVKDFTALIASFL